MIQLKQYIKSFINSETSAGVDIFIQNGDLYVSYIILHRKNEKVSVLEKKTGISGISGLDGKIQKIPRCS